MPLHPDQRLSHYRLLEQIGEGGMGVVWRAEDTRLGREAAIKVLPEESAWEPERRARFEREARILASLNHPNIAGIHGLEEAEGLRFLALEYVPGRTLAERLAEGRLPVDEALEVCRQIADAMGTAHEAGVLHRDLKPANIKITPDGTVKVLDFGLAKGEVAAPGSADPSLSPTVTSLGTRAGVILGTAAYMSPEQARGRPVDRRADVWAFGCLLYECLVGRRTFDGDTISDALASLLKSEPDWKALPRETPPRIVDLLQRCLEKDPRQRMRDLGDARIEIERALREEGTAVAAAGAAPVRRPWALAFAGVVAGIVLGATVVWLASSPGPPELESPPMRTSLEVGRGVLSDEGFLVVGPQLSPDGRAVAFASEDDGQVRLFLRHLDRYEPVPVAGAERVRSFTFSPDGTWIAFVGIAAGASRQRLFKVPVDGSGPPVAIHDWEDTWLNAVRWLRDGYLVTSQIGTLALIRIPEDGGTPPPPLPLTSDGVTETISPWSLLPGGRHVLASSGEWRTDGFELMLAVIDLETGAARVLRESGARPQWLASGHVIFSRHDTVLAAPFDAKRLEFVGAAVPLLGGVRATDPWSAGWFDVSGSGNLVYLPGGKLGTRRRLLLAGPDGKLTRWSEAEQPLWPPLSASPDGRRFATAWTREENFWETWVADVEGSRLRRLIWRAERDCMPNAWWPDGETLLYRCDGSPEGAGLFRTSVTDLSRSERILEVGTFSEWVVGWAVSPDGRYVLATRSDNYFQSSQQLLLVTLTPGSEPEVAEISEVEGLEAIALSPDGNWIAYLARQAGARQLFLRSFSDDGRVGPEQPLAVRDPTALYGYRRAPDGAGELVVDLAGGGLTGIAVRTQPRPAVVATRALIVAGESHNEILSVTALPGDRLLLMEAGDDEHAPTRIHLVQGWQQKLSRR